MPAPVAAGRGPVRGGHVPGEAGPERDPAPVPLRRDRAGVLRGLRRGEPAPAQAAAEEAPPPLTKTFQGENTE